MTFTFSGRGGKWNKKIPNIKEQIEGKAQVTRKKEPAPRFGR